jgi:ribosomal-protein-alanine N-acetyltransferase
MSGHANVPYMRTLVINCETIGRFAHVFLKDAPITSYTFHLDSMTQDDVTAVSRVERRCFANPWPISAYRRELRNRAQNTYVVLRAVPDEVTDDHHQDRPLLRFADSSRVLNRFHLLPFPRRTQTHPLGPHIAGFAGMWTVFDEAHITTIGVDPIYRGQGFGELLFLAMVDEAIRRGSSFVTLEVRVSNTVAQELYQKYGLKVRGRKRGYYSDDGEDAFVMWSQSLRDEDYLVHIEKLRMALVDRVGPGAKVPTAQQSPWIATPRPPHIREEPAS